MIECWWSWPTLLEPIRVYWTNTIGLVLPIGHSLDSKGLEILNKFIRVLWPKVLIQNQNQESWFKIHKKVHMPYEPYHKEQWSPEAILRPEQNRMTITNRFKKFNFDFLESVSLSRCFLANIGSKWFRKDFSEGSSYRRHPDTPDLSRSGVTKLRSLEVNVRPLLISSKLKISASLIETLYHNRFPIIFIRSKWHS